MTHAPTAVLRLAAPAFSALVPAVLLAALLPAALLPAVALAQPTPPAEAGLPSLTPRVFTSTGPTRVALPQVVRQPLTGFGPPPRSYVVPAERVPVVEPFEPAVEALPPLAIAAPAEPAVRVRAGRSVRVEALAGSYFARQGRLDVTAAGEAGLFFVDVDADGLSGSGSDAYVHSDRLAVRAGGQSYGAGRLRLDGIVDVGTYSLPGASAPDRRRRFAAGTTVGVSGLGAVPYEARVGYTQSSLGGSSGPDDTTEGRIDGDARVGLARNRVRLDAAGGLARAGGTAAGGEVTYASGGLAVAAERASGARIVVGVRAMLVRAADAGGADTEAVGPVLDARLPLSPAAVAFATNAPRLDVRSLAALAAFNPYAAAGVVVAPDVFPVDARLGIELGRGATRVRLYGAGTVARSRLVFEGTGGFFSEAYLSAATAGVGADLTAGSPAGVSASAGVEARVGRTTEGAGTEALPFFAPFVARAAVAAPFAAGRGRAGLSVAAESARPTSRFGSTTDTPAFALVGLDVRFDVGGPFAVVARAERAVGTVQRWPGYREAPFTALLGLRLTR